MLIQKPCNPDDLRGRKNLFKANCVERRRAVYASARLPSICRSGRQLESLICLSSNCSNILPCLKNYEENLSPCRHAVGRERIF